MVQSEGNMSLKNPVTTPGIDPRTFRIVAQRLNQYATPGPLSFSLKWLIVENVSIVCGTEIVGNVKILVVIYFPEYFFFSIW